MERTTARARLTQMVAAAAAPTLTEAQVDELLNMFELPDATGAVNGMAGWVGAYNLNGAAAEGYRWKAAAVAGGAPFSADGASYDRGKATDRLLSMAKTFQDRADAGSLGGIGYIEVEGHTRRSTVLPVVNL